MAQITLAISDLTNAQVDDTERLVKLYLRNEFGTQIEITTEYDDEAPKD